MLSLVIATNNISMHFNNMVVGIQSKKHEVTLELVINARTSSTDNETKQSNEGTTLHVIISRANVARVGSVFNDTTIFPLSFQVVREPLPFAYTLHVTVLPWNNIVQLSN